MENIDVIDIENISKNLCAMLNQKGGLIYLGICPNQKIVKGFILDRNEQD